MKPGILIIDSDMASVIILRKFLSDLDYTLVGSVTNCEDLYKTIEHITPDVAIINTALRGKCDSIDIAEELFEKYDIPVVVLTDPPDITTIERLKKLRTAQTIVKPFSNRELEEAIVTQYSLKNSIKS